MSAWLQHPGFQSAAAPFIVALVLVAVLARARLAALGVVAGVMVCVHLAVGLDLFPLNATRRIVLLTLAALVIGLVVDRLPAALRMPRWVAAALGAAAGTWVTFPALANREMAEAVALGGLIAASGAVLALGFDRLATRPMRASCAALGTGMGVGIGAVLGASASLGQIGLALGAASGGLVLYQMIRGATVSTGRALTLPAALLAGSLGAAAVVLAQAPWYALPLLAATPFACALPIGERWPVALQAVFHGAAGLLVAAVVAGTAWHAAGGGSSGY